MMSVDGNPTFFLTVLLNPKFANMPFSFSIPPPTITIAVVNFWKVSSSARRLAGVKML